MYVTSTFSCYCTYFSLSLNGPMFTYFGPPKKEQRGYKEKMERITAAFYDSASKLLRPNRTNKMSLFAINMARDFAQIFLQPGNWSLKAGLHFSASFFPYLRCRADQEIYQSHLYSVGSANTVEYRFPIFHRSLLAISAPDM